MLSNSFRTAVITLTLGAALVGCAGPTTPFGGLNPWELPHDGLPDVSETSITPPLNFYQTLALRGPASDVDLLIDPGPRLSLLDHVGLETELMELLGRKVDLVSSQDVRNPYFLEVANRHRVPLYAA